MAKPDSSCLPYLRLLYECLIINIDTDFQKGPVYAYITIFPNNRDIQRASRRRLRASCSRGWPKSGRDQTYPVFHSLLHVTAELDNSEEMVNLLERMGCHWRSSSFCSRMTRKHKTSSKHKINKERRTAMRRDTCLKFISYGLGKPKVFIWFFFGVFWTKLCRLNKGIFVHLYLKQARTERLCAFPSHQTEQLDGRGWIANFCNFLGCNWSNLNIGTKIANWWKHQGSKL